MLQSILSDVDWMEQIAFSGEIHSFARVVQIINAIAEADKGALKKGVARDTTTAVALEWALNNVHIPDWQYPDSCWRCGYILDNVYGDSIHGVYILKPKPPVSGLTPFRLR